MSDLQDLTAAGNTTAIPGKTISPPRLIEWAEAEVEAAHHYLRTITQAASELGDTIRHAMHSRAIDNLKNDPIVFGSPGFDAWALSASALPFLLWLSLRIRHPRLTRNQAAEYLAGPDGNTIAKALWDLWGYRDAKKTPAPPTQSPQPNGGASSNNSPATAEATDTATSPK